jgi:transcriptional regulator with GAF, ATPase, and Fis domain
MPVEDAWEKLALRLGDTARSLLAQQSVQGTLDKIVSEAIEVVDGCEAAGILTIENGRVCSLAVTDDTVRASDRMQEEAGEGPCFDATRRLHEAYRIADLATTVERWPSYAPAARSLGLGSVMGFLLYTGEEDNLGALNLYSRHPQAFTQRSEQVGWLFASHAAVALSAARTHAQLSHAMDSRAEIGEAIGIVMERYRLDEDQAFTVLRKSSQDRNVKLREVARLVARTGEIPGVKPRKARR